MLYNYNIVRNRLIECCITTTEVGPVLSQNYNAFIAAHIHSPWPQLKVFLIIAFTDMLGFASQQHPAQRFPR